MVEHSRRNFLKQASVAGAAVGAAAVIPVWASGDADAAAVTGPAHDGPFVAWVKDAKSGQIAVMVGDHEVVHQDRRLAASLARIAAQAPKA